MTTFRLTPAQYTALMERVKMPTPEELFEFQREKLVDKRLASNGLFDHFWKHLPNGFFLLVPPQPAPVEELDWYELMARVELDNEKGRSHLNPKHLMDEIGVLKVPTMLVDVEDGRGRLDIPPMDSRVNIPREGRTAYHLWMGYIHTLLFPSVLKHHHLDMVSSRRAEYVPHFCLYGAMPILDDRWWNDPSRGWGAPSYGSVET
jgi:hypothetical protein